MTLNTWIKINYGTQQKLNDSLGLSLHQVNRWYNHNPRKFLIHLSRLSTDTDTPFKVLIEMIEQREVDVKILSKV